ncbi:hypothetical protein CF335_g5161 [Tilletia laevis]|nr:hypothetical protein CF335_g5161 [Tilletia laevis]
MSLLSPYNERKLDTVEDRIERLEKGWLPHTRVDTPSTAERGTASTADTDRATITHPNSVLVPAVALAALSTTATARTTIIHHSVTTSTAFISPLTMTRSPPPPMLFRASSTAPRPPRFPAHKQASTSGLEPAAAYTAATDCVTTTPQPISTSAAAIPPLATTRSTPPPMA